MASLLLWPGRTCNATPVFQAAPFLSRGVLAACASERMWAKGDSLSPKTINSPHCETVHRPPSTGQGCHPASPSINHHQWSHSPPPPSAISLPLLPFPLLQLSGERYCSKLALPRSPYFFFHSSRPRVERSLRKAFSRRDPLMTPSPPSTTMSIH